MFVNWIIVFNKIFVNYLINLTKLFIFININLIILFVNCINNVTLVCLLIASWCGQYHLYKNYGLYINFDSNQSGSPIFPAFSPNFTFPNSKLFSSHFCLSWTFPLSGPVFLFHFLPFSCWTVHKLYNFYQFKLDQEKPVFLWWTWHHHNNYWWTFHNQSPTGNIDTTGDVNNTIHLKLLFANLISPLTCSYHFINLKFLLTYIY